MNTKGYDVAVIGAGIIGLSTAYYLKKHQPQLSVCLTDPVQPMSFTSAQSGENYRNWWPHPVMTQFTDHSIDLMEDLAGDIGTQINMTRRGYVLCTRSANIESLLSELHYGYSESKRGSQPAIRVHEAPNSSYLPPDSEMWQQAPDGVDVLKSQKHIQQIFPTLSDQVNTVVHIRRAGAIDSHGMGQHMLRYFKEAGGVRIQSEVMSVTGTDSGFVLETKGAQNRILATQIVNAAGPYLNHIAEMFGETLPVSNVLQQKLAFEDTSQTVPRTLPFCIDLDAQQIDWTEDELASLQHSEEFHWLTETMPGAIHCRPEGGDHGNWVKLGWAFNDRGTSVDRNPELMDAFPEIVVRGAAQLQPALKTYYQQLPRSRRHYGGYYNMTEENWPLIGAMKTDGVFVAGAMSGFGTMAACGAGDLCARTLLNLPLPHYAPALSPARYGNAGLMKELAALSQKGIL